MAEAVLVVVVVVVVVGSAARQLLRLFAPDRITMCVCNGIASLNSIVTN
jgi:hypothetical protein